MYLYYGKEGGVVENIDSNVANLKIVITVSRHPPPLWRIDSGQLLQWSPPPDNPTRTFDLRTVTPD